MADTPDRFELRKSEWQAWGLVMTVFTFAVLVTHAAWKPSVHDNDGQVISAGLMWLGLAYAIYRALKNPPLVTVDSRGITYHGFIADSMLWTEVIDIEVDWFSQKNMVVHRVVFKAANRHLVITDLFAADLVDGLLEHLSQRRESKKFIGNKQQAIADLPARYGVDPITRQMNWIMLAVFGFALIAAGVGAAYLESPAVGIPTILAGVLVFIFVNRSWRRQ